MFPFETVIFGTHFDNDDGSSRSEIITRCHPGERLLLKREPRNTYDRNAVAIFRANGEQLGYLSRRDAARIAAVMDRGVALYAYIEAIGDEEEEEDDDEEETSEEIVKGKRRSRNVVMYRDDVIPEVHIVITDLAAPINQQPRAQVEDNAHETADIHYKCECGRELTIPAIYVGQSGTCNYCGARFTVPRPPAQRQSQPAPSKVKQIVAKLPPLSPKHGRYCPKCGSEMAAQQRRYTQPNDNAIGCGLVGLGLLLAIFIPCLGIILAAACGAVASPYLVGRKTPIWHCWNCKAEFLRNA